MTIQTPIRLLMVTADNNNKFYNMTPQGDSFLVEYGRVGVTKATATYPMSKWKTQYNSKVKKGYKDITELVVTSSVKSEYQDITEPKINALFNRLLGFAKTSVKANYTISSDAVTQKQVDEAQEVMNELTKIVKLGAVQEKVNKLLLNLYTVIPRRMAKVQNHLLHTNITNKTELQDVRTMIDNEQKTLDVMAGQVKMNMTVDPYDMTISQKTVLDALGIVVELADHTDEGIVQKLMGTDKQEFRAVYRVIHTDSRSKYDTNIQSVVNKNSELFWHGSRNENWISILQTGLKIRPSNAVLTGAMFGHGIYFADKYRKSANYTSLTGSYWAKGNAPIAFLALMDVHLGKQYEIVHHSHECYNLNKQKLQQKGDYDSVFAKGGADLINNEYIVYDENQSTIKYLVEVGK